MYFLAHLIFNQMCYCCRKLEKFVILYVWEAEFGRPWEAVGGHAPLIGSDRSHSQSGEHGLPWPPKFGLTWPHTASHRLGLPQFVMWSVWANQGSMASHGLPLLASHGLPSASHFGLPRPPTSASHFGLQIRPLTWPLTWPLTLSSYMASHMASHLGLSHGL